MSTQKESQAAGLPPMINPYFRLFAVLACPEPVEGSLSKGSPGSAPQHKNAKQTQFAVPPSSRWLHRVQKIRNEPNSPPCHPERRAAERNAAAQSRGIHSITIADGDSLPVTTTTPTRISETNLISTQQIFETNPIPARQKNETNPIFTPLDANCLWQKGLC